MSGSLADLIRAQASISARPGQLEALEALADRVAEQDAELGQARMTLARVADELGCTREQLDLWYARGVMCAWHEARARITALESQLEAAQRPPLGYVVGWEGVEGPELHSGREVVHHDEDVARVTLADMRKEEPCMDFQLYEVREVQP